MSKRLFAVLAAVFLSAFSIPTIAQQGVLVYETTLHVRPPFYKGEIPLKYLEGKRSLGGGFGGTLELVYWQKFPD